MDLREYLFHHRLTVKEFSEMLDCSRAYISAIIHGKREPSIRLAKSIERVTNGEVTVKELTSVTLCDTTDVTTEKSDKDI